MLPLLVAGLGMGGAGLGMGGAGLPPLINVDAIPTIDPSDDQWVFDTHDLDLSGDFIPTWT